MELLVDPLIRENRDWWKAVVQATKPLNSLPVRPGGKLAAEWEHSSDAAGVIFRLVVRDGQGSNASGQFRLVQLETGAAAATIRRLWNARPRR